MSEPSQKPAICRICRQPGYMHGSRNIWARDESNSKRDGHVMETKEEERAYLRNVDGSTYDEVYGEAIQTFLSTHGYRITIMGSEWDIVIRKAGSAISSTLKQMDLTLPTHFSVNATVTFKKR